jgi:hypothetical protein
MKCKNRQPHGANLIAARLHIVLNRAELNIGPLLFLRTLAVSSPFPYYSLMIFDKKRQRIQAPVTFGLFASSSFIASFMHYTNVRKFHL